MTETLGMDKCVLWCGTSEREPAWTGELVCWGKSCMDSALVVVSGALHKRSFLHIRMQRLVFSITQD